MLKIANSWVSNAAFRCTTKTVTPACCLRIVNLLVIFCILISCNSRIVSKKDLITADSIKDSLAIVDDSAKIIKVISNAAKARAIRKIRDRVIAINLIEKFDSIDHTGQVESETLPFENDDNNGFRDWSRETFYYHNELKMTLESSKSVIYPYCLKSGVWKKEYYRNKKLLYRYVQNTNYIYTTDTARIRYLKNTLGMKSRFEATEQREYYDKSNLIECLCKSYGSEKESNPGNLFDTIANKRCK
jgi:hypothetical protein